MITQGIGGTIIRPANVAEMMSSGLELSITSQNIKTKDFNWTTSFIYSYTHSEITKLYNQGRIDRPRQRGTASLRRATLHVRSSLSPRRPQ